AAVLCCHSPRSHPRDHHQQHNPTDSIEDPQAFPQNCFLVLMFPWSLAPCLSQKKTATTGRPLLLLPHTRSTGCVLHLLGVHVEVRVHILHVVEIFQGLQQPHHLVCGSTFQLVIGRGHHRHLAHHRGNARSLHRAGNRFIR